MFKCGFTGFRTALEKFSKDTFGGITAFTVLIFLLMLVAVGMAVDFMRHETHRAELQDAIDRGVLAAASFNQTISPKDTVKAYLKSTTFVQGGYDLDVKLTTTTGSRKIEATASYPVDTFFLKIIGINTLDVVAKGSALEGASKIEVSLALDISTSMSRELSNGTYQTRLEVLQTSANGFIDSVFDANNGANITMSLIPFAGQVNLGGPAYRHFAGTKNNADAKCVELATADFSVTTAPAKKSLTQMQYFQYSGDFHTSGIAEIDWGWCPTNRQKIEYFSDSKDDLKRRIQRLRTHEATGTQYGMKYAAMLLDPDANELTTALVAGGVVPGAQSTLPRPYSDTEVEKFIVIMTDGNTTSQDRLKSIHYTVDDGDGVVEENEIEWWKDHLPSEHSAGWDVFETLTTVEDARAEFLAVCSAAKANGVYIFTIGFDIADGSDAQTDLAECARNGGEFYDVEGTGLATAFSSIASTIQKLRLIN